MNEQQINASCVKKDELIWKKRLQLLLTMQVIK